MRNDPAFGLRLALASTVGVSQAERSEVLAIVESTREDIVVEQSPKPAHA
jgi:hypothetical protein